MNAIQLAGRAAGVIGILLCLSAGAARVAGHFWVGPMQSATLLQGGIAALAIGCFLLLWTLVDRQ